MLAFRWVMPRQEMFAAILNWWILLIPPAM